MKQLHLLFLFCRWGKQSTEMTGNFSRVHISGWVGSSEVLAPGSCVHHDSGGGCLAPLVHVGLCALPVAYWVMRPASLGLDLSLGQISFSSSGRAHFQGWGLACSVKPGEVYTSSYQAALADRVTLGSGEAGARIRIHGAASEPGHFKTAAWLAPPGHTAWLCFFGEVQVALDTSLCSPSVPQSCSRWNRVNEVTDCSFKEIINEKQSTFQCDGEEKWMGTKGRGRYIIFFVIKNNFSKTYWKNPLSFFFKH